MEAGCCRLYRPQQQLERPAAQQQYRRLRFRPFRQQTARLPLGAAALTVIPHLPVWRSRSVEIRFQPTVIFRCRFFVLFWNIEKIMNPNHERNELVKALCARYAVQKINWRDLEADYPYLYAFAFIRECNRHAVRPDIYLKKGALANLGLHYKGVSKNIIDINGARILVDVTGIGLSDAGDVFCRQLYGSHLGLLAGKRPCSFEMIQNQLCSTLTAYFSAVYKNYRQQHEQLLDDFLSRFSQNGLFFILKTVGIESDEIQSYVFNHAEHTKSSRISHNDIVKDIVKIPFLKPYSDYPA